MTAPGPCHSHSLDWRRGRSSLLTFRAVLLAPIAMNCKRRELLADRIERKDTNHPYDDQLGQKIQFTEARLSELQGTASPSSFKG